MPDVSRDGWTEEADRELCRLWPRASTIIAAAINASSQSVAERARALRLPAKAATAPRMIDVLVRELRAARQQIQAADAAAVKR